jgi:hypothetical protein
MAQELVETRSRACVSGDAVVVQCRATRAWPEEAGAALTGPWRERLFGAGGCSTPRARRPLGAGARAGARPALTGQHSGCSCSRPWLHTLLSHTRTHARARTHNLTNTRSGFIGTRKSCGPGRQRPPCPPRPPALLRPARAATSGPPVACPAPVLPVCTALLDWLLIQAARRRRPRAVAPARGVGPACVHVACVPGVMPVIGFPNPKSKTNLRKVCNRRFSRIATL